MRKHQLETELAYVKDAWEQDQKLNATLTAARDARIAELAAENARLEEIVRSREEVINQISNVISGYRMAFVLVDEAYTMEDDKETNFIVDPEPIMTPKTTVTPVKVAPTPLTKRVWGVARMFGYTNNDILTAAKYLGMVHVTHPEDWLAPHEITLIQEHLEA